MLILGFIAAALGAEPLDWPPEAGVQCEDLRDMRAVNVPLTIVLQTLESAAGIPPGQAHGLLEACLEETIDPSTLTAAPVAPQPPQVPVTAPPVAEPVIVDDHGCSVLPVPSGLAAGALVVLALFGRRRSRRRAFDIAR